jgi:hypothetical protein
MPTKEQLHQIWATEFEFPWTRREDDPAYVSPEKAKRLMYEHKPPTMLPQEIQKQIESEAQQFVLKLKEDNDYQAGYSSGCVDGYEKGATVWAEKAHALQKELDEIRKGYTFLQKEFLKFANEAREREKVLVAALRDIASRKVLPQMIAQQALASYRGETKEIEEPEMGTCGDCGRATNNYLGNQYYQCDECAQKEVGK